MKKWYRMLSLGLVMVLLAGCGSSAKTEEGNTEVTSEEAVEETLEPITWDENAAKIELSDDGILVDGEAAALYEGSSDTVPAVYTANDIIFYLEGQGIAYGEGSESEEHSQEEADAHTVVHITQPGTYELSGSLSKGQIFVDLGEDAKKDESAVVTLVLNGVDVTCEVAPAILFYQVYECGNDGPEEASETVDITGAGANVIIADGTENNITGSHVAKIYESCELNEDGTEVIDSSKLHKYDGALYSKRSMNVYGGTGVLNIVADNEGLDSELHMTIHGGKINIRSGNDGINTNEDEVSVFTMNGGELNIVVEGQDGEGDGIDSNGWLVVNGGKIQAQACSDSEDAGIDSDMGIHINGGTVIATGNMMDRLEEGGQAYLTFMSREKQSGGTYTVKNADGEIFLEFEQENDFQILVVSSPNLDGETTYTLWKGDTQVAEGSASGMMGGMPGGQGGPGGKGGMQPGGRGQGGEKPEDMELSEGMEPGERPDGMEKPDGEEPPAKPE